MKGQTSEEERTMRRVFCEALEDKADGIILIGIIINNFRCADDTIQLATSKHDLQALLTTVTDHSYARVYV